MYVKIVTDDAVFYVDKSVISTLAGCQHAAKFVLQLYIAFSSHVDRITLTRCLNVTRLSGRFFFRRIASVKKAWITTQPFVEAYGARQLCDTCQK